MTIINKMLFSKAKYKKYAYLFMSTSLE